VTPDPDLIPSRPDYVGAPDCAESEPSETLDPFDQLVWEAVDTLPDAFRERLDTVAIVVEDEPSLDDLRRTGAPGLLGLYTGVPRTAYGASEAPMPSKITIYRGPHLRNFGDGPALAAGVAATVRHEVAHHFGISDARLEQMAREAMPRG
jgi:predicted Zn-dependent protease with MMP-like domain